MLKHFKIVVMAIAIIAISFSCKKKEEGKVDPKQVQGDNTGTGDSGEGTGDSEPVGKRCLPTFVKLKPKHGYNSWEMTRDTDGKIISTKQEDGKSTEYEYNSDNNISKITKKTNSKITQTLEFDYSVANQITEKTSGDLYKLDSKNRIIEVSNSSIVKTVFEYEKDLNNLYNFSDAQNGPMKKKLSSNKYNDKKNPLGQEIGGPILRIHPFYRLSKFYNFNYTKNNPTHIKFYGSSGYLHYKFEYEYNADNYPTKVKAAYVTATIEYGECK